MSSPHIHTYSQESEWITSAVDHSIEDLPHDGSFSLALSGGSTPSPIYRHLAQQDLPWQHAEIFQVDERFIAPDRPESNQRLLKENFENILRAPVQKIHFFQTQGKADWQQSAQNYHDVLQSFGKPFDVCILGIGPDGHTASLFPKEPAILETKQLATTSETNQFAVWKRLTITFPVILRSKKLIVLLKGREKKTILQELLNGDKTWTEFPAKKLWEHPNLHIFFCEA